MSDWSIADVNEWYVATVDSIAAAKRAVNDGRPEILDTKGYAALRGASDSEMEDYFRKLSAKHEVFAVLALFATCEGGIRRDLKHRVSGTSRATYTEEFRKLHAHVDIVKVRTILSRWKRLLKTTKSWMEPRLLELENFFVQRNQLAHGQLGEANVNFATIYKRLDAISAKWGDAVPDFGGF